MQTDSGTSLGFDLADMISGLPPAISAGLGIASANAPRQSRRLPERILVAAHQACDLGDLDIAGQLLAILETVIGQGRAMVDPAKRRTMESLIAAHQRLWHLRHADEMSFVAPASSCGFHESVDYGAFGSDPRQSADASFPR